MCTLSQYTVFHMSECVQEVYRGNIHLCVLSKICFKKSMMYWRHMWAKSQGCQLWGVCVCVCVCVYTKNYEH